MEVFLPLLGWAEVADEAEAIRLVEHAFIHGTGDPFKRPRGILSGSTLVNKFDETANRAMKAWRKA